MARPKRDPATKLAGKPRSSVGPVESGGMTLLHSICVLFLNTLKLLVLIHGVTDRHLRMPY